MRGAVAHLPPLTLPRGGADADAALSQAGRLSLLALREEMVGQGAVQLACVASKGKGVAIGEGGKKSRQGLASSTPTGAVRRTGLFDYLSLLDTRAPSMKPISYGKVALNAAAGALSVTAGPGKTLRLLSDLRGGP